MTDDSKPTFRLIRMPNGLIKIEMSEHDADAGRTLDLETSVLLSGHIVRAIVSKSYVGFMLAPNAVGVAKFVGLDITSDSIGVACVTIGRKASLLIDDAYWRQSMSV